jgi:glycosyltransferase involved in cell wall biosynthesis
MPDLGFIGNLDFGDRFHNRRVRMFHDIAQQMDFTLYGLMAGVVYKRRGPIRYVRQAYYAMFEAMHRLHLESVARRLPHYGVWRRVKEHKPYVPFFSFLEPRLRPPVFGLEMYQVLSRLKIGLNAHGPSTYASNMRLFETTGVGTCLLTDWKPNLPDLFEPDSEVVDYRSPEEAVEKARYLLDHPAEREAIATAGQRRTLRDHTYTQRAEELDAVITDQLRSGHSR